MQWWQEVKQYVVHRLAPCLESRQQKADLAVPYAVQEAASKSGGVCSRLHKFMRSLVDPTVDARPFLGERVGGGSTFESR
jgi:hypothetical protein